MLSCSWSTNHTCHQSTLQRWIVWHQSHHKQFTVARVGAAPRTRRHWQRSTKTMYVSFFSFLTYTRCQMTFACSRHSENPLIPAFCNYKGVLLQEYREPLGKNTEEYLSFHNRNTDWCNWSKVEELFSLGVRIHPTLRNAFGRIPLASATFISLQRSFMMLHAFLWSIYGTKLSPEVFLLPR